MLDMLILTSLALFLSQIHIQKSKNTHLFLYQYTTASSIMNIRSAALLACACIVIPALRVQASDPGIRGSRPKSIICHVLEIDVLDSIDELQEEIQEDPEFKCKLVDHQGHTSGMKYTLDLPPDFVQAHPHLGNGESFVSIAGGRAVWKPESMKPPTILYEHSNSTIQVVDSPVHAGRYLKSRESRTHGNKTILVLRVTSLDATVQLSKETLSERIFGIGENVPRNTVSSQYSACSFGKLNFIPAEGSDIVNGVAEISISTNVANMNPDYLEAVVATEAEAMLGTSLDDTFDHILFVYPAGTLRYGYRSRWFAYADIGGQRTFYNNENAGYLSMVMHEIGHNFGLYHSSEHSRTYGDTSGRLTV